MSRSGLFKTTCIIRAKDSSTTDDYGQFIITDVVKGTFICGFKELNAIEVIGLGLPLNVKVVRFYLEHDVDIVETDEIILGNKVFNVEYINDLGGRLGACKGLQVDAKFIGLCDAQP